MNTSLNRKPATSLLENLLLWGTMIVFMITPLLYWQSRIAAAVTSKQYFFIGIVELLLLIWIALQFKDSRYLISKKTFLVSIPVLLFVVSAGVSSFVGSDILTSLFSTIERGGGFVFLMHALVFTYICASLARVRGTYFLKKIGQSMVISGVVVSLFTFFTKEAIDVGSVWLNESAGGAMLGNSTIAGAYLTFVIFVGLIAFLLETHKTKKILTGAGLVVVALSPVMSGLVKIIIEKNLSTILSNPLIILGSARAASAAIVIGLIIAALYYTIKVRQKKLAVWGAGLVMGVIIITIISSCFYIFKEGSQMRNAFISSVGENRLIFWEHSFKGINERPLFGWGPENYKIVHQKYFNPLLADDAHGKEIWVDKPHSSLVEIVVTQGYVGLFIYTVLILVTIWIITASVDNKNIGAETGSLFIGLLAAYLLQNQLAFDSIITIISFFAVIGVIIGLYQKNDTSVYVPVKFNYQNSIVIGIVILIMIPVWLIFAYFPARKAVAIQTLFNTAIKDRMVQYDRLYRGPGSYIVKTSSPTIFYKIAEAYLEQRTKLKSKPELLDVAIRDIQKIIELGEQYQPYAKNDYRFILAQVIFQSSLIYFTDNYSKEQVTQAFKYADAAIRLSPTNPFIHMMKTFIYLYDEDVANARKSIDKAVALNPKVKEAHLQKIGFENAFGTYRQQQDAIEYAKKNIEGF